ncbi:MAG: KdsC family phosphatase [Fusobacteriaceae bacterium]
MLGIKMIILDVDGTLTDGKINMSAQGEVFKSFSVKDGLGISAAIKLGIDFTIITGRSSKIVTNRASELGINHVHQGIKDKLPVLESLCKKLNLKKEELAYIGDDVNDLDAMRFCGLTGAPYDAVDEVKNSVDFVSTKKGGEGAVREFIEFILQKENKKIF